MADPDQPPPAPGAPAGRLDRYRLGPTNWSSRATLSRWEIETFRQFERVHLTPSRSQVRQKIAWMSAE